MNFNISKAVFARTWSINYTRSITAPVHNGTPYAYTTSCPIVWIPQTGVLT